jgi:hypothetical protein
MYVLRFSAELVKPFSPGATVQPSTRFEVPLIKAESEFDLLPIPIFPRSGHFDGASAEVGFSLFFCLSHSRDLARITLSISLVPVWRARQNRSRPRGLAGSNYLSEEHYQQARQRGAEDKY